MRTVIFYLAVSSLGNNMDDLINAHSSQLRWDRYCDLDMWIREKLLILWGLWW